MLALYDRTKTHLDDGALGDDAQGGVRLPVGVLLDADDFQAEGALELRVRHVRLVHAQPCSCIVQGHIASCSRLDAPRTLLMALWGWAAAVPCLCQLSCLQDLIRAQHRSSKDGQRDRLLRPSPKLTCGADEALILWRLAGEAATHKGDLGQHALPLLLLPLARPHDLEHLVLSDGPHLRASYVWMWYGCSRQLAACGSIERTSAQPQQQFLAVHGSR